MRYNKVCDLEDFADEEFAALIRETSSYKVPALAPDFPRGSEHRKDWEVAMAIRTLRDHGALRRDATILGVAVGTEDTVFYLTRHVQQVFATDRYLFAEEWDAVAPMTMLVQPDSLAPYEFDANRLVVQHMDARSLRYPDDTFDAIFSSGSIEHFGELLDVAHAAYEMGRVMRPGGVLSVSTEFKLAGPPGGMGWPGLTLLFSPEQIQRFIVEASGLEPVDDLDVTVSQATLATKRGLVASKIDHDARMAEIGAAAAPREFAYWDFPHVVMMHEGYVFGSVHLALRKPTTYPVTPNAWARPSEGVLSAIAESNRAAAIYRAGSPAAAADGADHGRVAETTETEPPSWARCMQGLEHAAAEMAVRRDRADATVAQLATQVSALDHWVELTGEFASAVDQAHLDLLRHAKAVPSLDGRRDVTELAFSPSWTVADVIVSADLRFKVVVDPNLGDPIADHFAAGHGIVPANRFLVELMLSMIGPGQCVIDLGAHVGTFALAAAALGCKVLAVEASAANAAILRASAAVNGFHELHVLHAAAMDEATEVTFTSNGPWGRVTTGDDAMPDTTVPSVTIDEVLYEFGWGGAAFVKMDVEGSELTAIRGMRRLLTGPAAPPVLFESNGHTLRLVDLGPEDLIAELEGLGYTGYVVEPHRLIHLRPGRAQPQTELDVLALKKDSPRPAGWNVDPSMTQSERVRRFVGEIESPNPHCRTYIAQVLESEGEETLSHPAIAAALTRLKDDPVDAVRVAAGWWTPIASNGRNDR